MKTKEEIEQLAMDIAMTPLNFIQGYTQCQEDMADKKYTEEDIREAIDMARMLSHVACLEEGEHRLKYSNTEDDIIKSLNKQDK
jgi:hypothetical protein